MIQQVHIIYSGNVQGIGFRYTAKIMADQLNIKGWIKNLRDGRVELIAQGQKEGLEKFIQMIDLEFADHILSKNEIQDDRYESFDSFEVRF